jgi:hypothetical protein
MPKPTKLYGDRVLLWHLRLAEFCMLLEDFAKAKKVAEAGLSIEGHEYERRDDTRALQVSLAAYGISHA